MHRTLPLIAAAGILLAGSATASASSHMDAPLITLDDAANTTDVYAFVRETDGIEVAGDGPRRLPVRGTRHRTEQVQLRRQRPLRDSRRDRRRRRRRHAEHLVPVPLRHAIQEHQDHSAVVSRRHPGRRRRRAEPDAVLHGDQGRTIAADGGRRSAGASCRPNNQGNATPFYNRNDNGENPAKDGVATFDELDRYTQAVDR